MKKNRKAEWAKNHESNWVEEEKNLFFTPKYLEPGNLVKILRDMQNIKETSAYPLPWD